MVDILHFVEVSDGYHATGAKLSHGDSIVAFVLLRPHGVLSRIKRH